MNWRERIRQVPVEVFSLKTTDTPSLLKGRVRIFYRGVNRNGSIINDMVAEQLVDTLAYIPVKGNYNHETEDFMGHDGPTGERIYGLVPSKEDRNFAWELHEGADGVIREYACTDIFIWTMYEEAMNILNKPQSMELHPESIDGDWVQKDGKYYFEFSQASFLGLQVLGSAVEPCFEDAAFYEQTREMSEETMSAYAYYSIFKELCKNDSKGGNMDIFEQILQEQEEDKQSVDGEVVEETPIAEEASGETVVENNESAEAGEALPEESEAKEEVSNKEGTEEPKEEVEVEVEVEAKPKTEVEAEAEAFAAEENNLKIVELEEEISTYKRNIEEYKLTISNLREELESLQEFKYKVDTEEKMAILNSYQGRLSDRDMADYKAKVDEFTAIELDKELAYSFVKNYQNFSTPAKRIFVPNEDSAHNTGIANVLDQYKNEEE